MLLQQPVPKTISHIMFAVVTEGWLRSARRAQVTKSASAQETMQEVAASKQTSFQNPVVIQLLVAHALKMHSEFFAFFFFFFWERRDNQGLRDGI